MEPQNKRIERRAFLRLSAGLVGAAALVACAPKAQPTAAPAAEAPKQVEKPTQAPVAAAPKEKVSLRVGAWDIAERAWMRNSPLQYAEQHEEVDVEVEVIPYAESMQKCMAGMATGTLPDVFFSTIRWGPYAAYKGAFVYLDDYVEVKDPGMDDWFPLVIEAAKWEDKMYCLPYELHPGRPSVVYYNKDLLTEKGVPEPTSEWNWDEFAEMASKITDRSKNIFGAAWYPTAVHDFISQARCWPDGNILSEDRKQCIFDSNEGALAAARFQVDMRTRYDILPAREESQGLQFYAGGFGYMVNCANIIQAVENGVGDKFAWDVVLSPVGPTGLRGAYAFIAAMSVGVNTKHPQEAYDLATYMVSYDVMKPALLKEGQNPCLKSLYQLPESHHIWHEEGEFLAAPPQTDQTWPTPWNLLFEEMYDTWLNLCPELWYGEIGFDEGVARLTREVQKVLDKPRP